MGRGFREEEGGSNQPCNIISLFLGVSCGRQFKTKKTKMKIQFQEPRIEMSLNNLFINIY